MYFSISGYRENLAPGIIYRGLQDKIGGPSGQSIKWLKGELKDGTIPDITGEFHYYNGQKDERRNFEQIVQNVDAALVPLSEFFFLNNRFKDSPLLVIPVWDIWLEGQGCGGIWAVLILQFAGDSNNTEQHKEVRDRFERRLSSRFLRQCQGLARELFSSAVAKTAGEGIQPPYNLAHHFIRAIAHVQDWEHITAYRGDEHAFCFGRVEDGVAVHWRRCKDCEKSGKCTFENHEQRFLSWGDERFSIWDRRFVPELTAEEVSQYGDYRFVFHYPNSAFVPMDSGILEQFKNAIFRQQMTVLGLLAPKVRAQRYALRRAVSGIMGRNMSHNIGSHVLARYASKIGTDQVFNGNKDDQRSDLLQYLQRRMDFLADIATSDEAFWFQSLSLKEQIELLNWDEQTGRLNRKDNEDQPGPVTNSGNQAEPVLLRFITGKENLRATVNYTGEDVYFACPGGEVGIHALFVVLENIVRNSARHGSVGDGTEKVALGVSFCDHDDKLLKLEIVDPRSSVCKPRPGEDKPRLVHNEINDILNEPILSSNGEPNAKNWGIREMQICAHYLRGFSLFDLQSAPDDGCPVLEASCHDGNLKYTIYLQRAKRMVVVRKSQGRTNLEKEEKIGRQGVKIIEPIDSDWRAIGAEVGSYEYLVVDSDFGRLPDRPQNRAAASLPVRSLNLSRETIDELVEKAGKGGSQWMEPLHERWAEQIRDKRRAWYGRHFFGVSIRTSDGALPNPKCNLNWPTREPDDGLIIAATETKAPTRPLPTKAQNWLMRLRPSENGKSKAAIAAAWIDHANKDHFGTTGCGLGFSVEVADALDVARECLWISAETARSGDPHVRFLIDANMAREHEVKGQEWEILAAAVSRVAVLDERVQSAGLEDSSVTGKRRGDLWRHMGVWTPEKEKLPEGGCDLDVPDFKRCKDFLKKPALRDDQYPIDILVVHLTILERLASDRSEPLGTVLHCLVADTQAADAEVVVVTGRGVPAVARAAGGDDGSALEGARYLPVSALLESLVARPSKLGLIRTLWSAGVPRAGNA